ncbi:ROK family protein [Longispora fulva]|uniref:Glucokinase n=1 Tax=Longispora fulva TaxID=619741 RepID=A0A8J7GMF6_9ACTN|nr:ROK family protein [Longispora fulva]MBG6139687.1 glucokinase [Longispora fulva]
MTEVLALDIGGTKLAAGLVGPDGTVLAHRVVPTPVTDDPEVVFGAVLDLLAPFDAPVIGVGSAGPLDPFGGTVSPLNTPAWRGFPLVKRLTEAYGRPVVLAGDGHCFALAEHWLGAGRGSAALLGMVVSTGVGGGLILADQLILGPSGNAGHIGHAIVDPAGPACACGSRGCVEAYSSGPSLVRWALSQGWVVAAPVPTARDLAASAAAGDPIALAAFDRGARALAAGILSAAAIVDLDTVVIGGGVAASGPILFDPLHRWIAELAGLDFLQGLRVLPARLTEAGVIGAAALAFRR